MAGSLFDAQEILVLVQLVKVQNNGTVNPRLNDAGAGGAGAMIRNAMISRLVMLVSRCYAKPKEGDWHLYRAFELLKEQKVRAHFQADDGALTEATSTFEQLKGDHRQEKVRNFRDKFTAHLGDPKDKPMPNYEELFDFAVATVECIEKFARALKIWEGSVSQSAEADAQAAAFWAPWTNGGEPGSNESAALNP
ncbi:hypothetical protein AB7G19_02315 [Bradyrhizobium sp. 215_C5_N1_1]|uniref:AbiU2 domain-containing protein n=1 Tax=unclassified Bradyrhizobium TaxID=2631580 RepID=UPI003F8A9D33